MQDWCCGDWKSFWVDIFRKSLSIIIFVSITAHRVVFVHNLHDSKEQMVKILSSSFAFDTSPTEVTLNGMDLSRQWYLHNEIAQFCSTPERAAITCPRPHDVLPSVASIENCSTTTKRKRTCSHCHKEGIGHTKTKRGKTSLMLIPFLYNIAANLMHKIMRFLCFK